MSKIPKDKRNKIILIAMGTVVVCTALALLVIKSQNETLKHVRATAKTSREQLNRGENTLKAQAEVDEEFELAGAALRERESAMAAPNDMYSWLITTLNNFRLGYKVEIPQFGREVPAEVGLFPKFPYRAALFTVRGTAHYHEFGKFLADFENAFPCIRVQNIELDPAAFSETAGGDAREKLNFKMELLTLVRPSAP